MASDFAIQDYKPVVITVTMDGKVLFTLHKDGRIERGPGFTTEDETSLKFWKILQKQYASFFDNDAAEGAK